MNTPGVRRLAATLFARIHMLLLPSPLLATSAEAAAEQLVDADELRCPICFALMLTPRMLPNCTAHHTFCGDCISFWLQQQRDAGMSPTCPIDRRQLATDERPVIDEQTEAAVQSLKVCCPNRKLGCASIFPLREGVAHLSECAFRTVQCPHCGKPQSAAKLKRHEASCFKRCKRCGVNVPQADELQHDMNLCLARSHAPWWSTEQAKEFTSQRGAVQERMVWLETLSAPHRQLVIDAAPLMHWERAAEAVPRRAAEPDEP